MATRITRKTGSANHTTHVIAHDGLPSTYTAKYSCGWSRYAGRSKSNALTDVSSHKRRNR